MGAIVATALRPLSTRESVDRAFSLYRRHFPLFLGIFKPFPIFSSLLSNAWRLHPKLPENSSAGDARLEPGSDSVRRCIFCRFSSRYRDCGFASTLRTTRRRDGFIFESEEPDFRRDRRCTFRRLSRRFGLYRLDRARHPAGEEVVPDGPREGTGKQGHRRSDVSKLPT